MIKSFKIIFFLATALFIFSQSYAQRLMERLDRGLVAIPQSNGYVYLGWRMFGTDSENISFNVYRSTAGTNPIRLNINPVTASTDFTDKTVDLTKQNTYYLKTVLNDQEILPVDSIILKANAAKQQYFSIPVRDGGILYAQSTIGDVDGDGQYEIILKWSKSANVDPGKHTAPTATTYIDAYKLNGTFLWRIDLGWNIETGSDYTPLEVFDMNGDGISEVITRTSEGTIDGTGVFIGDINGDGITDYRDGSSGRVITGPEFMSVFRGTDGKEIARTNWIERGIVSDWGDNTGNRSCRYQMGIAYLDGVHPSIIMSRGVYAYQVVEAWNFADGKLTRLWRWDNGGKGQSSYYKDNAQCFRMGDIDGDGKDEIVKGQMVIDDNGTELWNMNLARGHGDFVHVGVFDPSRSGLQIFKVLEVAQDNGVSMQDAKTGTILWGKTIASDAGRGYCSNIDARYKGAQCWAGAINNNLFNYDGTLLCTSGPNATSNLVPIWWDGLCRSLTDEHSGTDGVHIRKWEYASCSTSTYLTAGTGTRLITYIGDIVGDWREELVIFLSNEIQIYTTTIPSTSRLYTLNHNPLYRLNVSQWAQRNPASSHPDYYLGAGMDKPPMPSITYPNNSQASALNTAQNLSQQFRIYPTTSSGIFTVAFGDSVNEGTLYVTNISGTHICSKKIQQLKQINIDLTAFPKGIYILRIETGSKLFSEKLVKTQ